jgi:hypothetical protein
MVDITQSITIKNSIFPLVKDPQKVPLSLTVLNLLVNGKWSQWVFGHNAAMSSYNLVAEFN